MKSKAGKENNTGSLSADEPVFVVIGKFRRPHDIKGEIVMTVITDFPDLIQPGGVVYVGERHTPYQLRSMRWHGADLLVSLKELPDRTAVEIFRNIMVYMKAEDVPELPEPTGLGEPVPVVYELGHYPLPPTAFLTSR